ncbi:MAG: hypothetical protein Q8O87_02280 [bacterium]|nr:hypothetical protein [bacterium]
MKPTIFKAYDVRGAYPREINEQVVGKIAQALVRHFKKGEIVVGYDARLSSPSLYKAILTNLKSKTHSPRSSESGAGKPKAVAIGQVTTPMLYFLVDHLKSTGGIMITASHNPKNYNGLKVVGAKAKPISGRDIKKLISN